MMNLKINKKTQNVQEKNRNQKKKDQIERKITNWD